MEQQHQQLYPKRMEHSSLRVLSPLGRLEAQIPLSLTSLYLQNRHSEAFPSQQATPKSADQSFLIKGQMLLICSVKDA